MNNKKNLLLSLASAAIFVGGISDVYAATMEGYSEKPEEALSISDEAVTILGNGINYLRTNDIHMATAGNCIIAGHVTMDVNHYTALCTVTLVNSVLDINLGGDLSFNNRITGKGTVKLTLTNSAMVTLPSDLSSDIALEIDLNGHDLTASGVSFLENLVLKGSGTANLSGWNISDSLSKDESVTVTQ